MGVKSKNRSFTESSFEQKSNCKKDIKKCRYKYTQEGLHLKSYLHFFKHSIWVLSMLDKNKNRDNSPNIPVDIFQIEKRIESGSSEFNAFFWLFMPLLFLFRKNGF